MRDLIERDTAIAMFEKELQATEEREECTVSREYAIGFEGVKRILDAVPPAQPELYGYKIEHLALIARVMQKEGVSPEKAVETFTDICSIVQMFVDEQKEIFKKAVEQWI